MGLQGALPWVRRGAVALASLSLVCAVLGLLTPWYCAYAEIPKFIHGSTTEYRHALYSHLSCTDDMCPFAECTGFQPWGMRYWASSQFAFNDAKSQLKCLDRDDTHQHILYYTSLIFEVLAMAMLIGALMLTTPVLKPQLQRLPSILTQSALPLVLTALATAAALMSPVLFAALYSTAYCADNPSGDLELSAFSENPFMEDACDSWFFYISDSHNVGARGEDNYEGTLGPSWGWYFSLGTVVFSTIAALCFLFAARVESMTAHQKSDEGIEMGDAGLMSNDSIIDEFE
eukprot:TRINITY_DN6633_c0_g1_i1.p1 TRINITY_DN6633_c0_g1~~TRINITY_DN6633_c0_g1_i1.p1  ORF type:complete len:288 (+),score=22.60 TRINITY_DN6633_c0_g1_i1:32-895(+)